MDSIKEYCDALAEDILDNMWDFSLKIYNEPELAFHEHFAKQEQVSLLSKAGFEVDENIKDLDSFCSKIWKW